MTNVSEVYDLPDSGTLHCQVTGRVALPGAVVELHRYRFIGPQRGLFRSNRGFLDLALSPRPGRAEGGYAGGGRRPLGDLLFVPAGHALDTRWGEGEQVSICVGFDGGALPIDDAGLGDDTLDACLDVRSPHVRDALARLAREIEAPGFASDRLIAAIWTETVIEFARYMRRSEEAGTVRNHLTPAQLRRIEERIEQPGRLPGVAELARECDLSTRHFFRMFRAATGTTLASYAAARRIARAKTLLAAPRPPVKEIAWRCGFETPAAFSAAFRRAIGVTPKEYRHAMLR